MKEYQITLNAEELNMVLVGLKRSAVYLTQQAWGDLEQNFLEASDKCLTLHNKITMEARKQ